MNTATASGGTAIKALRSDALERMGALAVPTTHDEAWRFTSIAALTRASLHAVTKPTPLAFGDIASWAIPEAGQRIVFVDGVHAPQLSTNSPKDSVTVYTLTQALATHAKAVMQHLGQHAQDPQPTCLMPPSSLRRATPPPAPRCTCCLSPPSPTSTATRAPW